MSIDNPVEEKNKRRKRRDEEPEDDEMEMEERGITERKGRATPSRRKTPQPSAVARTGSVLTRPFYALAGYFGNVRSEIEKVTWPSREETARLTRIVLVVTIAAGIILGVISLLFSELFVIGLRNPIILIGLIVGAVLVTAYYIRRSRTSTPTY